MEQTEKKPVIVRHSKEQINEIVAQYNKKHGLTIKEFCKLHHISEGTFYSARSRNHAAKNSGKKTGFIAINPSLSQQPSNTLFAQVRGIKIYQPVPADYLKALVS